MGKPLHFNAFVMNTASHIHHGQWRREDARQSEFNDVNTWIDLAKTLEAAKFDAMFFADVSGLYGDPEADFDVYAHEGLQIPSNDPTVLLGALAVHTKHIGLATTSNVVQNHPFNFARQMSTLDHISNGRIAWNIVTGINENASRNYGLPALTDHTERYAWAEEYVDVAYKLWEGSWDEGALLKDKDGGRFSDPSKIHKIHHQSARYRVEGPHLPAPSPQRTPVLFQAGSSTSGREFAARNAEAAFIIAPSQDVARQIIEDTRRRAVAHGRAPEDIKFFAGLSFVIGETEAEAKAKSEEYDKYVSIEGYLAHMAILDRTGRVYPPKTPLSEVDTNTSKGFTEWISKAITDREPLVEDLAWLQARNSRIVGTPEQIADQLEQWQAAGLDGINVMNWVLPGSFEEFGEKVMPVLRARGLAQSEYSPGTLREKLFGEGPLLNERHPAAAYRGAFTYGPRSWEEAAALQAAAAKKSGVTA